MQLIYTRLEEMLHKMQKIDCIVGKLITSEPELKDSKVNYHSEKLAVTFGMISLPPSAPIRVMKNLSLL